MYTPSIPPSDAEDLLRWAAQEFWSIDKALNTKSTDIMRIGQTHNTPDKPRDGDIRYATGGSQWDPGYGTGPYIWEDVDSSWHPMFGDRIFDIECFSPDKPTASMLVLASVFARTVRFPTNLSGSYGKVMTAPNASAAFDLKKNGSSFGTMTFASSATAAAFSATAIAFAAGDVLTVYAPASANATMSDVFFTLKGTR